MFAANPCTASSCSSLYNCVPSTNGLSFTCVAINNLCVTNNGGCGSNSICTYTSVTSATCTCTALYTSATGANCTPLNQCLSNNGGCGALSTCSQIGTSVSCACQTGSFGTALGKNCQNYSVALPGQFVQSNGTATSNRVISTCAAGYSCAGGFTSPVLNASPSTYCPPGSSNPVVVPPGSYSLPIVGPATSMTLCPPGFSCVNGVRTACVNGSTFQPGSGQVSCLSCSTCAYGLNVTAACTATANITCAGLFLLTYSYYFLVSRRQHRYHATVNYSDWTQSLFH